MSRISLVLVALFVCLCPQTASAQTKGYAVQVAALSSKQNADELAKGLAARGINAYWVKGASLGLRPARKEFYRVRIGKFPTIESAYGYAEQLLKNGLLDAYAIAAYEPPAGSAPENNTADEPPSKVQSFTPEKRDETIDVVAAIGTRGWLLLSSKSLLSTPQDNDSALGRELARLAVSVASRGWRLNNNIANLLAPPIKSASAANSARPLNLASAGMPLVDLAPTGITPVPTSTIMSSASVTAPEGPRRPASPAIPGGGRTNGSGLYTSPPRLQGMIEMRDGRMFMKLHNTDLERSFTGVARITLSDDKNEQDVAPMQFTLSPDREESFPIDEALVTNGNWILMLYDENGTARLVRGASLAPKQPVQNAAAQNAANRSAENQTAQGPPAYVTGFADTTSEEAGQNGWTLSQNNTAPSNPAGQMPDNAPVPSPETQNSPGANAQIEGGPAAPRAPQVAPGQVTVVPRQIAVTTENVTMEFDISAPSPLNYIVVTLRAGDFQDTRQALMSTPVGRVPFLIPTVHTSAGFSYEIKDENNRVLANGSGDFRSLGRGN